MANIPTKIILLSIRLDDARLGMLICRRDADKNAASNQRLYEKHSSDTLFPPTSILTNSPLSDRRHRFCDAAILLESCLREPTSRSLLLAFFHRRLKSGK